MNLGTVSVGFGLCSNRPQSNDSTDGQKGAASIPVSAVFRPFISGYLTCDRVLYNLGETSNTFEVNV